MGKLKPHTLIYKKNKKRDIRPIQKMRMYELHTVTPEVRTKQSRKAN